MCCLRAMRCDKDVVEVDASSILWQAQCIYRIHTGIPEKIDCKVKIHKIVECVAIDGQLAFRFSASVVSFSAINFLNIRMNNALFRARFTAAAADAVAVPTESAHINESLCANLSIGSDWLIGRKTSLKPHIIFIHVHFKLLFTNAHTQSQSFNNYFLINIFFSFAISTINRWIETLSYPFTNTDQLSKVEFFIFFAQLWFHKFTLLQPRMIPMIQETHKIATATTDECYTQ